MHLYHFLSAYPDDDFFFLVYATQDFSLGYLTPPLSPIGLMQVNAKELRNQGNMAPSCTASQDFSLGYPTPPLCPIGLMQVNAKGLREQGNVERPAV
jgi:hypothetical protein